MDDDGELSRPGTHWISPSSEFAATKPRPPRLGADKPEPFSFKML